MTGVLIMAQVNVKLNDEQFTALRQYAARRRTPVAWLIKDYIAYLLAGGEPVLIAKDEGLATAQVARMAGEGGSFDWLKEEPDIYSLDDGEPVP